MNLISVNYISKDKRVDKNCSLTIRAIIEKDDVYEEEKIENEKLQKDQKENEKTNS